MDTNEGIRAKDILPHKTSFSAGDGFYGDGDTSFFMEAKKLLELTAENALAGNVAPAFDPTRDAEHTYLVGEFVIKGDKLYKCIEEHSGIWNPSHFESMPLSKLVSLLNEEFFGTVYCSEEIKSTASGQINTAYHFIVLDNVDKIFVQMKAPSVTSSNRLRMVFRDNADNVLENFPIGYNETVYSVNVPTGAKYIQLYADTALGFEFEMNVLVTAFNTKYLIDSLLMSKGVTYDSTDYSLIKKYDVTSGSHLSFVFDFSASAGSFILLKIKSDVSDNATVFIRDSNLNTLSSFNITTNVTYCFQVPSDAKSLFVYRYTAINYSASFILDAKQLTLSELSKIYAFNSLLVSACANDIRTGLAGGHFNWLYTIPEVTQEDLKLYIKVTRTSETGEDASSLYIQQNASTNLKVISIEFGKEYLIPLPVGTTRLMLYKYSAVSADGTYTVEFKVITPAEFEKFANLTDDINEPNSLVSQDSINGTAIRSRQPLVSNQSKPIVAMIYDDSLSEDLVTMAEQRGLKVTFAPALRASPELSMPEGSRLRQLMMSGHGSCAHGQAIGLSPAVPTGGLDKMNDYDAVREINAINNAFDFFKLSRKGLVQFDTWENNPHVRSLCGRSYDYVVGFGSGVNAPGTIDPYYITRANSDYSSTLTTFIGQVKNSIGKNVLLVFGGHMSRTGHGGGYSTAAQFEELLDLIAGYVVSGDMISMCMDDAVNQFYARCESNGVVQALSEYDNPVYGRLVVDNDKVKVCLSEGEKAVYKLELSGVPQNGAFAIDVPGYDSRQEVNITTTSSDTIESIVDAIVSSIYKGVTVRKIDSSSVSIMFDLVGVDTMSVTSNTSGLTVQVTNIIAGVDPVFSS